MPIYKVGSAIKELRKRQHITQEQLCEGLCEPPSLSKIESGKQNPTKKLFEALMSRLGAPTAAFNMPVSEIEYKRSQLEHTIINCFASCNYQVQDLLQQYRECSDDLDNLEKQFYYFSVGVVQKELERDKQKAFLTFMKALKQTFPAYEIDYDFSSHLLTVLELMMLNNIALCLYASDENRAIALLIKLEDYFLTHDIERTEFSKQYPVIIHNLVPWLAEKHNYTLALEYAIKGVDCCLKYGKLLPLPILLYNKGFLQYKLGNCSESIANIQYAVDLLLLLRRESEIQAIKNDLTQNFNHSFLKKIKF